MNFRNRHAGRVIQGVVEKIDKRMHYSLKIDQRSALKRVVAKIEQEAYDAMKVSQEKSRFDIDGYWHSLIEMEEFHFCILGTQRINYASLFFAYEDFLAGAGRNRQILSSLAAPASVSARKSAFRAAALRLRAMLSLRGCCLSKLKAIFRNKAKFSAALRC